MFSLIPILASVSAAASTSTSTSSASLSSSQTAAARDAVTWLDSAVVGNVHRAYVGMLSGHIHVYRWDQPSSTLVFVQTYRPTTAGHIVRLCALTAGGHAQCLAVLAGTMLAFHDLSTLQPISSIRPIKAISAIATNSNPSPTSPAIHAPAASGVADSLLIARRRSIVLLGIRKSPNTGTLSATELREFPFPDGVLRMAWHGNHVYVADNSFHYKSISLHHSSSVSASTASPSADPKIYSLAAMDPSKSISADKMDEYRPHLVIVSNNEVLVVCKTSSGPKSQTLSPGSGSPSSSSAASGIILNSRGQPAKHRPSIHWPAFPLSVAIHYPFILALLPDPSGGPLRLSIHSLIHTSPTASSAAHLIQLDPIPIAAISLLSLPTPLVLDGDGAGSGSTQFQLVCRERDALYAVPCPSYISMIQGWLNAQDEVELDAIVDLAARVLHGDELRKVLAQIALRFIARCRWDDALDACKQASVDPRWIVWMDRGAEVMGGGWEAEHEVKRVQVEIGEAAGKGNLVRLSDIVSNALSKLTTSTTNPTTLASLTHTLTTSSLSFALAYLDHWRIHSTRVDPLVELARLDLMLRLASPAPAVAEQAQIVCDVVGRVPGALDPVKLELARHGYTYASTVVDMHLGRVGEVVKQWRALVEEGTGSSEVAVEQVAQVLATQVSAADAAAHVADVQWIARLQMPLALDVVRAWIPRFDARALHVFGPDVVVAYIHTMGQIDDGDVEGIVQWVVGQPAANQAWINEYQTHANTRHVSFIEYLRTREPEASVRLLLARMAWDAIGSKGGERIRGLMEQHEHKGEYVFELAVLHPDRAEAVKLLVGKVHDFKSAQRVCEHDGVGFDVIVDAYLNMPNRDAWSSYFMSVAVQNLGQLDFDKLLTVLPASWSLSHAAPLLTHELVQVTRKGRWAMMVKSLERQRNVNAKLASLSLVAPLDANAKPSLLGAVALPANCCVCGLEIADPAMPVVVRLVDADQEVAHTSGGSATKEGSMGRQQQVMHGVCASQSGASSGGVENSANTV
ncbi:hypothetical protein BCR44DRAFT_171983 [Catenaria anguillulae PL171]|uniref:CNH domain-containing protein n=1 Tax=Catenaria anguillulae PL171 TaxID=765915 RepID=A0A1Y2HQD4_9FUNG|nr:hypothetical protein BCR44DRAFT_171983 [Catenaria anguillulae PL171]